MCARLEKDIMKSTLRGKYPIKRGCRNGFRKQRIAGCGCGVRYHLREEELNGAVIQELLRCEAAGQCFRGYHCISRRMPLVSAGQFNVRARAG